MTEIKVTIPGECVPKGRPRLTRYGVYTPPKTKTYESKVRAILRTQKVPKLEGALKVTVVINRAIPKSMTKQNKMQALAKALLPTKKPDLDNYVKAVLDACNGIAFHDDSAICELQAYKFYSNNPRVELKIEEIVHEN